MTNVKISTTNVTIPQKNVDSLLVKRYTVTSVGITLDEFMKKTCGRG